MSKTYHSLWYKDPKTDQWTMFGVFRDQITSNYGKVQSEMSVETVKEWFDFREIKTHIKTAQSLKLAVIMPPFLKKQ